MKMTNKQFAIFLPVVVLTLVLCSALVGAAQATYGMWAIGNVAPSVSNCPTGAANSVSFCGVLPSGADDRNGLPELERRHVDGIRRRHEQQRSLLANHRHSNTEPAAAYPVLATNRTGHARATAAHSVLVTHGPNCTRAGSSYHD